MASRDLRLALRADRGAQRAAMRPWTLALLLAVLCFCVGDAVAEDRREDLPPASDGAPLHEQPGDGAPALPDDLATGEVVTGDDVPGDAAPEDTPAPHSRTITNTGHVDVWHLSLREALQWALRSNLTLEERRFDLPRAHQAWIQADAGFDRLLTAGVELSREERPSTSTFFGADEIRTSTVGAYAGVGRRLRDGSQVSLLYRADRIDTNQLFTTIDPAWQHALSAEYRIPLARGRGWVATSALRRAQNAMHRARALESAEVERVVLAVVEQYWALTFAQRNIESLRTSERVARKLLVDIEKRLEADYATPLDVSEAQAGIARRRSELLAAEQALEDAQDQLVSLIHPFSATRTSRKAIIATDDPSHAPPDGRGVERWIQLAIQGRPGLRAQRIDLADRGIDLYEARDGMLPSVDLTARVGSVGYRRGFDASLRRMLSGDTLTTTVGIEFSMYLGRRAARAKWRAATWAQHQATLRLRETENQIVRDVRQAHRAFSFASRIRDEARIEVDSAQRALEGERLRLREGASTPFRVLQKEQDVTLARTRHDRAEVDMRIAQARLWFAAGMLASQLRAEPEGLPTCRTCREPTRRCR